MRICKDEMYCILSSSGPPLEVFELFPSIVWTLLLEREKGGLGASPLEFFASRNHQTVGKCRKLILHIYTVLIFAWEGWQIISVAWHTTIISTMHQYTQELNYSRDFLWLICQGTGDFFCTPRIFPSSCQTHLGLPTWNVACYIKSIWVLAAWSMTRMVSTFHAWWSSFRGK